MRNSSNKIISGYLIYASEIRKRVIAKNPDVNFGDISRLVGIEWKELPQDVRSNYDHRAQIHNERVREKRAQRQFNNPTGSTTNDSETSMLIKRKLKQLVKKRRRQNRLSNVSGLNDSLSSNDISGDQLLPQASGSSQPRNLQQTNPSSHRVTVDSSTQTNRVMFFVEPPTKDGIIYCKSGMYIEEDTEVASNDFTNGNRISNARPRDIPEQWLGSGLSRYDMSSNATFWGFRDFMLNDARKLRMRRHMEPHI